MEGSADLDSINIKMTGLKSVDNSRSVGNNQPSMQRCMYGYVYVFLDVCVYEHLYMCMLYVSKYTRMFITGLFI